jgi:hypothetical protein
VLEGVERCGLLVVLDIVADLNGRCPQDAGDIEDSGVTTFNISRQARA